MYIYFRFLKPDTSEYLIHFFRIMNCFCAGPTFAGELFIVIIFKKTYTTTKLINNFQFWLKLVMDNKMFVILICKNNPIVRLE